MNTDKIVELLFFTLPALITGGVAYYFFLTYTNNEEKKRQFLLHRSSQKQALPLKLQAYERMTLFLERINLTKILIRIAPISTDKNDYANLLIAHIDQEFEHNLTQQIYMSDQCWALIVTAKNSTMQMVRKAALSSEVTDADSLRQYILNELLEKQTPGNAALAYLKDEVSSFL
ncbi:MAG: hypothetical protein CFE23_15025 [Flavobacterium sp. BFFFF1]|uniref:DUF7935 family protein n=1 Tax=unclassified Flavobacterium TaxID=196869 RepID=UPI000BC38776|nr:MULTISPECIES: hypothetical protein [unclassified Flavobacterium]OYU79247.1 MAG: hypothetical protein CFE23_15025 [Flavobacterium sp. BFFFF1]